MDLGQNLVEHNSFKIVEQLRGSVIATCDKQAASPSVNRKIPHSFNHHINQVLLKVSIV